MNIMVLAMRHRMAERSEMPCLSLPSEIRNMVYAVLFERAEPLHIVEIEDDPGKMTLHRHKNVSSDSTEPGGMLLSRPPRTHRTR